MKCGHKVLTKLRIVLSGMAIALALTTAAMTNATTKEGFILKVVGK